MPQTKKVILADDDPGILDAVGLILEYEGYELHATDNGNQVFQLVCPNTNILLLDIWMSGSDGRDICKQLKSDQQTKHIPIILFSAGAELESSAKAAGADDFIPKPFDMIDLVNRIERLTNSAGSGSAMQNQVAS
ncbi:response regulator [Pedobacter yulinensis]|uniref:Response regulator n=1 Tax=Pedobacter yulinensis TaxID=2126353 RepID=A0A2T3HKE3_9SPHI|nr:response regulator transcription factor [Pedobacter yulinensis]PST82925.1 response regulator [Pedobacter yulinensis]